MGILWHLVEIMVTSWLPTDYRKIAADYTCEKTRPPTLGQYVCQITQ